MNKKFLKHIRRQPVINRLVAKVLKMFGLMTLASRWPLQGIVKLKFSSHFVKFYSNCDDYLVSNLYYDATDEEIGEFEYISKNLITDTGRQYLDIGSYNGLFALFMAKKDPQGSITAFEPNPANFFRIEKNVLLNNMKNIRCVNAGVSDHVGKLDFYLPDDYSITTVSSFSLSFASNHTDTSLSKIEVNVTDLDLFCQRENLHPDVLKIDVEGHEWEVIKGAMNTIRRCHPVILCEIFTKFYTTSEEFQRELPAVHSIEQFLKDENYMIYVLENGDLAELVTLNIDFTGRNFMFIPNS